MHNSLLSHFRASALLVAIIISSSPLQAEAPRALPFEAILKTPTGRPVSGNQNITLALYTAATGSTPLYTETKTVAVSAGLLVTTIGTSNAAAFAALPFNAPYWVGVKVGADAEMTPRLPLAAVPYANYALNISPTAVGGVTWLLGGNSGTNPASHFLGTKDAQPLLLKVNNRRALSLEDKADPANTYHAVNVIGGAQSNAIAAGVMGATIGGGGRDNNTGADNPNEIWGNFGTVNGGSGNFIDAFTFGTIGGGSGNNVQGHYSTVGGGAGNNPQGDYVTIGGGSSNFVFGTNSTIGGGLNNAVTGNYATVAGGDNNAISAGAASIGGGQHNQASSAYGVIGGGFSNVNSGQYGTLSGGAQNTTSAFLATLAGGSQNAASGQYSAIGGGSRNKANADTATIAGGDQNTVNGTFTNIGGGRLNYGWSVSDFSTIGGGYSNTVYGDFATIPGGYRNYADGLASLSAGYRAYAEHDGSFVWADAHEADFVSAAANEFCIRATGGLVLEAFGNFPIFTGVGTGEANRYVLLLNSPRAASATGLKAGGILCADSFDYANPGKNNMAVKGTLGVGYPDPAPYTFAVNGTVYSKGGYSSSDARFKRDVHDVDQALRTILGLRGVSFEWNRDAWKDEYFPPGRQIGFIAQEVETVLPEVVSTDAKGFKAVSYQSIVPVLVEAVKALKAEIADQAAQMQVLTTERDAQIAELRQQNASIEERLRKLEATVYISRR